MEQLELTDQERDLILKQRQDREIRGAGGYGSAPRLGPQESDLLAQMDTFNQNRLTLGYSSLPRDISRLPSRAEPRASLGVGVVG